MAIPIVFVVYVLCTLVYSFSFIIYIQPFLPMKTDIPKWREAILKEIKALE